MKMGNKVIDSDYEEIVTQIQEQARNSSIFDSLLSELVILIANNINTKRSIFRPLLIKKMEELKSYSKHRLSTLLITHKKVLPFLNDDFDIQKLRYAKFVFSCLRQVLNIPKLSLRKRELIGKLIVQSRNKNELIAQIESYLMRKNDVYEIRAQTNPMVSEIERFLVTNPHLSELINKALRDFSNIMTNRISKLHDEKESDLVELFTQKEIDRILQIIKKNPDVYYLIFPYWEEIADMLNMRYLKGKKKGFPNDTMIIKWILNHIGVKFVDFKDKKFKKIQKRWITFKNNHK